LRADVRATADKRCENAAVHPINTNSDDSSQTSVEQGGPGDTYAVILLYHGQGPELSAGEWALPKRVEATPTGGGWMLADPQHVVTGSAQTGLADPRHVVTGPAQKGPALSVVMPCAAPPDARSLASALAQTWTWPSAAEAVVGVRSAIYVGELMGRLLPREHRLGTLLPVITGVVRATRPAAVLWTPAGYLAEPRQVLEHTRDVLVNVRMFRIHGADDGAVLMDTMGLAPLGLPDLQCKAYAKPGWLVAELKSLADHLVEHGDVIADGQAVPGADPGTAWRAWRRTSLAQPVRQVLDLAPLPADAL
jgi:hypothetical protein